ncbi:MAG TPA: FtsX-like permease family protein [Myxococcota bacterium]|nr:FtsX-like permease family protein [Myxococcota bacterium]HPB49693.1 FtsX-like permease family protein [Myxococcota bacterium]HQP94691.1 FtsX-like permease family protein [Myxococcota bacterium]
MLQFLKLCWRDLWRNRRRTILTGLVMTFSVTLLIFSTAIGDGAHEMMIRASTESFTGHGQIQHPSYRDDPVLENTIEQATIKSVRAGMSGVPGVKATAPRLITGGLATRKTPDQADPEAWKNMSSEGVVLLGVSPVDEATVSTLATSVVADDPKQRCADAYTAIDAEFGAPTASSTRACASLEAGFQGRECMLAARDACAGACTDPDAGCTSSDCEKRFADYCEPARFLAAVTPEPDEPWKGEAVIGTGLAMLLGVGVGDRLAVTSGTARGRSFGSIYRVTGLLKTGSLEINRQFVVTQHDKLSQGLEVPGAATQIVFAVDDLSEIDDIGARARTAVSGAGDLSVLTWKQITPDLDVFIKIDQGSMLVMLTMMVMVVAVLLANVVIMAGMERTREFGVRLAMGESPGRLTAGLITETMLLALLSGAIGAIVGESLVIYFSYVPIDFGMGEMESGGVVVNTALNTSFRLYGLVFSVLTVWLLALAGALVPAFRTRRLKPVEAIRFV